MCGRFTLRTPMNVLISQFLLESAPTWNPRFNICPTQQAPVVRVREAGVGRECVALRWGLVPSWGSDLRSGSRAINARSQTVFTKPTFRAAARRRRCLVLADGYFEWKQGRKPKQPYLIQRPDGAPFVMAGLWESWSARDPQVPAPPIETFAILTTEANRYLQPLHDRMPVILEPQYLDLWLDPKLQTSERLQPLLKPCGDDSLTAVLVSTYVNSPTHDSEACVRPLHSAE